MIGVLLAVGASGAAIDEFEQVANSFRPVTGACCPYVPPPLSARTNFVILSSPRSATASLANALSRHVNVTCHGEVFHPMHIHGNLGWTIERREQNRSGFMSHVYANERLKTAAVGFKVFHDHLTREEYAALVRAPHVRKIVLERENHLGAFLSHRIALGSKCWTAECAADARGPYKAVTVRVGDYLKFKRIVEGWFDVHRDEARLKPESWLFVTTESVTTDPTVIRKVYAHLRVSEDGPQIIYRPYDAARVGNDEAYFRAKIANYDEFMADLLLLQKKK